MFPSKKVNRISYCLCIIAFFIGLIALAWNIIYNFMFGITEYFIIITIQTVLVLLLLYLSQSCLYVLFLILYYIRKPHQKF